MLTRLSEIVEKEGSIIDPPVLKKLILDTNYDISSWLNILSYASSFLKSKHNKTQFASKPNEILHEHLYDKYGNLRYRKDMQSSLFDSWDKIMIVTSKLDPKLSIPAIKKIYYGWTQPDKLLEGIFINYSSKNYYDDCLKKTIKLLYSFVDHDVWDTYTNQTQQYDLAGFNYLPAANYHVHLSSTTKSKNEYPNLFFEIFKSHRECSEALKTIKEGYNSNPTLLSPLSQHQLLVDIIPYIPRFYHGANLIKSSIVNESQAQQLKTVLNILKAFPVETIIMLSKDWIHY